MAVASDLVAEHPNPLIVTAGYYAAFVALGLVSASMGPTLPGLAEHTHSLLGQVSYVFTARSLGYMIGSSQGGRLYDRMAAHPLMAAALMMMAALMILTPLVPLLWLLAVVLTLLGIAEGTLDVGGNTLLVWVHDDKVGPFMNGLHLFFGVGAFLSPLIVAWMVKWSGDIVWAYWMLALLAVPVAVWLTRLRSPAIRVSSARSSDGRTSYVLVILIALFFFLCVGAEISMGGWIFTYAVRTGLGNETTAAYLNSAFWGAFTLGRLLAIPVAVRVRPATMLLSNLLGCLVGVGVIWGWSQSVWALWLGVIVVGLFVAPLFATLMSFAGQIVPLTGRVAGLLFIGISAGGMVAPWLIGQLFEQIGPQVMLWTLTTILLAGLIIFAVLYARTLGRTPRPSSD